MTPIPGQGITRARVEAEWPHEFTASGSAAELANDLFLEIARQDATHPSGYPPTRDGVRLGIATVQDELDEARAAWRAERCKCGTPACTHPDWTQTEIELMQATAVALRAIRAIRASRERR